jgi:KTSC domain
MPRVSSSAMYQVEWSAGTLSIWFHESGKYDYYRVPESVYLGLLAARSKGTYFNDHIRDRYGLR